MWRLKLSRNLLSHIKKLFKAEKKLKISVKYSATMKCRLYLQVQRKRKCLRFYKGSLFLQNFRHKLYVNCFKTLS